MYARETSRTLNIRGSAHYKDNEKHRRGYKGNEATSFMWAHTIEHHKGILNKDTLDDFVFLDSQET